MIAEYHSPCGLLRLGAGSSGLVLCDWMGNPLRERRSLMRSGATASSVGSGFVAEACRQLDLYFVRKLREFSVPLSVHATLFQSTVISLLMKIRYGQVISYLELAQRLGRPDAVRAVAGAVGANIMSIFIPCHRIIGSDGRLTGYAGGLDAKRFLLSLERGVVSPYGVEQIVQTHLDV